MPATLGAKTVLRAFSAGMTRWRSRDWYYALARGMERVRAAAANPKVGGDPRGTTTLSARDNERLFDPLSHQESHGPSSIACSQPPKRARLHFGYFRSGENCSCP
jgi:hypothetical protein